MHSGSLLHPVGSLFAVDVKPVGHRCFRGLVVLHDELEEIDTGDDTEDMRLRLSTTLILIYR